MGWGRKEDAKTIEMKMAEIAPAKNQPIYNPKRADPEKELAQVRKIEDQIFLHALRTVEGIGRAADYDDGEERSSVTPGDIAQYGTIEAAIRVKRIAMDARRPEKDAPVYLKHQHNMAVAIMKDRTAEQAAKSPGAMIQVNVFMGERREPNTIDAEYQELELDEEDE